MKEKTKPAKPLTMAIRELKAGIESAVARCGLPACLVEPIVFGYWLQLKASAEEQERAEAAAYQTETDKGEETP